MVSPKLLKRPHAGIIVVRDAGVPHPENDIDADRTFAVGEQISVHLDYPGPLRQPALRAEVVDVGEKDVLVAKANHSVYRVTERGDPDNPVVKFGTEIRVPRECVFTVWKVETRNQKAEARAQVVEVPFTVPAGTKEPLIVQFRAMLITTLKLADCSSPHDERRVLVLREFLDELKKTAEEIEYRIRNEGQGD